MKFDIASTGEHLAEHSMDFLGGSQIVAHRYHFNRLWDQTMDDALGVERGIEVRTRAAHKAAYKLLSGLVDRLPPSTPAERLGIASSVFAAMGQGKLELAVGRSGGLVRGDFLHYGWGRGWGRGRRGDSIGEPRSTTRCSGPTDAFGAGFAAAATEVAYDLDPGMLRGDEHRCVAEGGEACGIRVGRGVESLLPQGVGPDTAADGLPPAFGGLHEGRIAPIVAVLRDFLGGVRGDDRGVIEAFGGLVTRHPADYYNHVATDALHAVERDKPRALEAFSALLIEAGRSCAFHTFGGVLASAEWKTMVGAPSGDPWETVLGCLALARAFGFGKWSVQAYEPERTLVLTSPGTYETLFGKLIGADSRRGRLGILPGAGVGIMLLAHGVQWRPRPELDGSLYSTLVRSSPWVVEETRSIAWGDSMDRVVVTRR